MGAGGSGSPCVYVTFGAWGWFKPPLPLGNERVVSHLPSRFASFFCDPVCSSVLEKGL